MASLQLGRIGKAPGVRPDERLSAIVDKIEATLDEETTAFTAGLTIDLGEIHRRKRQGLLELTRLVPVLSGRGLSEQAQARLLGLSKKLEDNSAALAVQLRAVGEVADIVAATVRASESDGTYSIPELWS